MCFVRWGFEAGGCCFWCKCVFEVLFEFAVFEVVSEEVGEFLFAFVKATDGGFSDVWQVDVFGEDFFEYCE